MDKYVVVKVKGFAPALYAGERHQPDSFISIKESDFDEVNFEKVEATDIEALEAEKTELLARVADIDIIFTAFKNSQEKQKQTSK